MGQRHVKKFISKDDYPNAIGYCDACGDSLKSDGLEIGPLAGDTICLRCAQEIAALVNGRAVQTSDPKPGVLSVAEEEAAAESARASVRRSRRTAAAVA